MKYRKVKDDIKNRCAVKRGGNGIAQMSGEGYLFTSLCGVRYKGGVIFTRGFDLEQGSIVCRCKREPASKRTYEPIINAAYSCGPDRSSVEASVMEVERRVWLVCDSMTNQLEK
jgi:hypothetical protein